MVGIYTRQSLDKKDSLSIDSQIDKCIALCNYNAWSYTIYKDKGFSGKDLNRPNFQKLMNDIKSGTVTKIICYRLDRISRSMADFSNLIVELELYNCEFISATENFDTSTPLGRAMVNIIMTFAQLERETVIERVTDNYYYRAALGHWGGGPAPYGYSLERKTFEGKKYTSLSINKEEAEVVKRIYNTYLEEGNTTTTVLDMLELMKIPSRNKKSWTKRTLLSILKRAVYTQNDVSIYNFFKQQGATIACGIDMFDGERSVYLYGKTNKGVKDEKSSRLISEQYLTVTEHPPLIDSSTWLSVQAKLGEKRSIPSRTGTGKISIFTGLLYCAHCGSRCSSKISRKKKSTYNYYICNSKKTRSKYYCDTKLYNQEYIDNSIIEALIMHIHNKHFSQNTVDTKIQSSNYSKSSLQNEIELQIAQIEHEIGNLISSIATGGSTVAKYIEERINSLDSEKTALSKKLAEVSLNNISDSDKYNNISHVLNKFSNIDYVLRNGEFEQKKLIVTTLINKVYLSSDGIDIEYII